MKSECRADYGMSKHHAHLRARRWAATRCAVFDRDGWRCVQCGKAGRLECDHVVPLERGGDPWDMDNLQTLCRNCHIAKTLAEAEARGAATPGRAAWRALVEEIAKG